MVIVQLVVQRVHRLSLHLKKERLVIERRKEKERDQLRLRMEKEREGRGRSVPSSPFPSSLFFSSLVVLNQLRFVVRMEEIQYMQKDMHLLWLRGMWGEEGGGKRGREERDDYREGMDLATATQKYKEYVESGVIQKV